MMANFSRLFGPKGNMLNAGVHCFKPVIFFLSFHGVILVQHFESLKVLYKYKSV